MMVLYIVVSICICENIIVLIYLAKHFKGKTLNIFRILFVSKKNPKHERDEIESTPRKLLYFKKIIDMSVTRGNILKKGTPTFILYN